MERGQTIQDRYEIGDYRASNSMVELYDAVDKQLERPVTLQVIHQALDNDVELAHTFDEHQKVALSLYHCSVVAVYDIGVQDGRTFSVMERFRSLVPADYRLSDGTLDIPYVLRITRQVAEGLRCCREAGLSDWAFTPEIVGLDGEGNARLAVLEGSQQPLGAVSDSADVAALGLFLRYLLASGETFDQSSLPAPVATLLDRVEGKSGASFTSVADLVSALEAIETAGNKPTQAYMASLQHRDDYVSPGQFAPHEAPTLAAPIPMSVPSIDPGNRATAELTMLPTALPVIAPLNEPVVEPLRAKQFGDNRILWMGLIGLAVAILLFAVLPRLVDSRGALATPGLAMQTPTAVPLIAVPDLTGMKIEDAQSLAGGYNLTVKQGASNEDRALPPDTVLSQEPPVGTLLTPGSAITVILNVLTQAAPTAPPPVAQPAAEQAPPAVTGSEHGKKNEENKAKGKDKGKDK